MLEYLTKKGKRVLITIDEVNNSAEMRTFFQAYQYFIRKKYPVYLLMTGLYENVSRLFENKSLTFLYRTPNIPLGSLNIGAISQKYEELLNLNSDTALAMAKETNGFAFAYQLLGSLIYESEIKEITSSLLNLYDQNLAQYVYDKIYSDLSFQERKIVSAFSKSRIIKLSALREKTGLSSQYLSIYRDRLIKKGILFSPIYGYLQFVLPRFEVYLSYKNDLLAEIEGADNQNKKV